MALSLDPSAPDQIDARLIQALQHSPRGSWSSIAGVVGVDPSTAARRWERLSEGGRAWITAYPWDVSFHSAFIDIDCVAGAVHRVGQLLVSDPQALSVQYTAGPSDLVVLVAARSFADLSHYVLQRLNHVPGVKATRTHAVAEHGVEGSQWHLPGAGRATPQDAGPGEATPPAPMPPGSLPWRREERRLLAALGEDGRRSFTELAALTGSSINTVRRRLLDLTSHRQVIFRCDIARSQWGLPISAHLWLRARPESIAQTVSYFRRRRETRSCAVIASGPANVLAIVWLPTLGDLNRMEGELRRELPGVTVSERSLVLGVPKLMGTLLDEEGRRTGTVPIDFWPDVEVGA